MKFENVDPEDLSLNVVDYVDVVGSHLSTLTTKDLILELAKMWKEEVNNIGIKFAFDENNEVFIPLKKYYATALKYAICDIDPTQDEKFNILHKQVGYNLEWLYYDEVLIQQTINNVHDAFFVDMDNEYLYNSVDRADFLNQYGTIETLFKYNKAMDMLLDKPKRDLSLFGKYGSNKVKWTNVYSDYFRFACSGHLNYQMKQLVIT